MRGPLPAVALLVVGGVLALVGGSQSWLRLAQRRGSSLPPLHAAVAGHTVEPAVTGLAVVALAGAVALLATAGFVRVAVGAVLAFVGAAIVWRSALGTSISSGRAQELLAGRHPGAVLEPTGATTITRVAQWPLLALVGGLVVLGAGVLVLLVGRGWSGLSSRYDAPAAATGGEAATRKGDDAEQARARADAALWQRVDRGEDPTL